MTNRFWKDRMHVLIVCVRALCSYYWVFIIIKLCVCGKSSSIAMQSTYQLFVSFSFLLFRPPASLSSLSMSSLSLSLPPSCHIHEIFWRLLVLPSLYFQLSISYYNYALISVIRMSIIYYTSVRSLFHTMKLHRRAFTAQPLPHPHPTSMFVHVSPFGWFRWVHSIGVVLAQAFK